MNDSRKDPGGREDESGAAEIERRLLDEQARSHREIVDAARRASEIDRKDPDSPERREREFGVEDPSHSKGSTRRRS